MTILITGAAGFIGSCIVKELNKMGRKDLILIDNLSKPNKWKNLVNCDFIHLFGKEHINNALESNDKIELIIHMGACSDTLEPDEDYLMRNNYQFSKLLFEWCKENDCRFIYASSAAVYGNGKDPLNAYGFSKLLFDKYINQSGLKPAQWVGLRFHNVYGHGECHKGKMASMVYQSYKQTKETGVVELFAYQRDVYTGKYYLKRDFIYIKDVLSIIKFFIKKNEISGLFDIGTGIPYSFEDLVKYVCESMHKPVNLDYKYMSEEIKERYQFFTKANLKPLRKVGYKKKMYNLEKGIKDYVQNYLSKENTGYY